MAVLTFWFWAYLNKKKCFYFSPYLPCKYSFISHILKVQQCVADGLGVQDGSILNRQLTASTGTASDGRLGASTHWLATAAAAVAPGGQYVEVFLDGRTIVTGVKVQGTGGSPGAYPTNVQVQYWDDSVTTPAWKTVQDNAGAVKVYLLLKIATLITFKSNQWVFQ